MTETPMTKDKRRGSFLTEPNVSSPHSDPPPGGVGGVRVKIYSQKAVFHQCGVWSLQACGATAQPPAWRHLQTPWDPSCILTFDFWPVKKPSWYESDWFQVV